MGLDVNLPNAGPPVANACPPPAAEPQAELAESAKQLTVALSTLAADLQNLEHRLGIVTKMRPPSLAMEALLAPAGLVPRMLLRLAPRALLRFIPARFGSQDVA